MIEVLTPICKAYTSDSAFRVTETAIQVYGGYGFCSEYPVEQFLRDLKIASLWEGTNGIQALDLVGRKLGMKKGLYFMSLLGEMSKTVGEYRNHETLGDLAEDVQEAVNKLAELAMFFASSAKAGKYMIPVGNAYPFLMLMGKAVMGWLLLWGAGVAEGKRTALAAAAGVGAEPSAKSAWIEEDPEAAFYTGKIAAARFFIKHVLPEVGAAARSIRSEDLSMLDIPERGFAP
jgi:hypothetical protein